LPVIGLFLVDCDLVNVSENVVRMSWSSNSEDSGDIEACIVAKRRTVKGLVEIFRNCTNASSGSFTNSIPDTGNAYVVTGEIFQDGVKGFCRNSVVFFDRSVASSLFGLSGLFGIVLLLLGMILLYAGQGEIQLVAAGVALVASWVLGLLSFPWEIISAVIAFLIIIILVGRYTKKQRVD